MTYIFMQKKASKDSPVLASVADRGSYIGPHLERYTVPKFALHLNFLTLQMETFFKRYLFACSYIFGIVKSFLQRMGTQIIKCVL